MTMQAPKFSLAEAQKLYERAVARKQELLRMVEQTNNFIIALQLVDGIDVAVEPKPEPAPTTNGNGKRTRRYHRRGPSTQPGELAGIVLTLLGESKNPMLGGEVKDFVVKHRPDSLKRKHVQEVNLRKRVDNTLRELREAGQIVSVQLGKGFGRARLYCLPQYKDRLTQFKEAKVSTLFNH